jgi:CubicO group peptidase (beta-lactamase class C family)
MSLTRRALLGTLLAAAGTAWADDAPLAPFDELMTSFVRDEQVPGAALAVTTDARLVYARGFGLADRERGQAVPPTALFRIASVTKPVTAVAILKLIERGTLALDARVSDVLELPPASDARWKRVTIGQLLRHTGGWDRDEDGDPMFQSMRVARAQHVPPPAEPAQIIRYMLGQRLDFDPGQRFAYSNFGYCLLGRVIERASGVSYEHYVQREVLAPLGIRRMRLGKTLPAQRAPGEVTYYDDRTGPAVMGAVGTRVPLPYGAWSLEAMDSHGGWLASAADLVRFASAFDAPAACKILEPQTIATMFARPDDAAGHDAAGKPRVPYYACGWWVRPLAQRGRVNIWHTGSLPGTSTMLVRRFDGRNWAVLFNMRTARDGRRFSDKIDPLLHAAAGRVRRWPETDRFPELL